MTETVAGPGPDTSTSPLPDLPGNQLRRAREAAGLSVEDVARQLHLAIEIIQYLEAGEYDRLAGTIYVTGYLRAYARVVGLDEDAILAGYQHSTVATPTLVPESVSRPRRRRAGRGTGTLAALAVVVLAVPALWWWSQSGDSPEIADGPLSGPTGGLTAIPAPEPGSGDAAAEPKAEPVKMAQTAVVLEPPKMDAEADSTAPGAQISAESPAAAVSDGQDPAPTAADNIVRVALEMAYHNDSWTDIRDSRGEILAYRMVEAGSLLELSGAPPLTVVLGYAPGVSITYNGRPFDMSAFTRNDIARFTVGAAPETEAQ